MAANNSNTSQAVQRIIAANPPQGLSAVEQAQNIVNPGSVTPQTSTLPAGVNMSQFGPNNPNAANWGPALTLNQGFTAGLPAGEIPSIIYYNFPPTRIEGPIVPQGIPNPEYVAKIPTPPAPEPEGPITQSATSSEVDEMIDQSNEVVQVIITNTPPDAAPVDPVQDIIKSPDPITPTELVLSAQATCEGSSGTPEINIEIINEIEFISNVSASATANANASAYASASAFAEAFMELKVGCMDPDAINYDPLATIPNPNNCEYLPPDTIKGCTNIEALNYNPDATEDDGSCTFIPALPPIPPMSQFLDSHGQLIFEIPSELVEDEGVVDMPKGNNVKITATRDLVNPNAINPIVRPAPVEQDVSSDLILTVEEQVVGGRKFVKNAVRDLAGRPDPENYEKGGTDPMYLADKKAWLDNEIMPGTEAIIIRNVVDDTNITRNNGGAIVITTNTPIVKVSLQSQAFIYEDYRKAIDTSFSELLGKM